MELLGLSEKDFTFILAELKKSFPTARFHFFGSRIAGTHRDHSDLDICIQDSSAVDLARLSDLKETLAQSSLSFTVDLSDWHRISPDFRERIINSSQCV